MEANDFMFKTTSIKFTSRASVKIGDSYYTFEACIEKQCPEDYTENEYDEAKKSLWNEANGEVDTQIEETYNFLKNSR